MTDQRAPARQPDTQRAITPAAATREHLLARHADARARRNAAALGSEAHRAAVREIGEIEVEIAALETGVPASKR